MTAHTAGDRRQGSRSYVLYVIGTLMAATLMSQLDRQLPALLVAPIKHEFRVSDTAFSLIQGYAFAIAYTFIGVPFGRLVDRTNRRNLILAGVIVWSTSTMLAGLTSSYWGLFATRIGVGVGEACLAPAAYSMIADYVQPLWRGRAIAAFYIMLSVGSGASLLVGGLIYKALPSVGVVLPVVGLMVPWRLLFILAGAPGIVVGGLLLFVREPQRLESGRAAAEGVAPFGAFLAYLRRHGATFTRVFLCAAANAPIGYGTLAWAPTFFDRRFGIPATTAALTIGSLVAIGGLIGTIAGGIVGDRWAARKVPAARLRVNLYSWLVVIPGVGLWPLLPSPAMCFVALAVTVAAVAMGQSVIPALLQDIVPNRMRGQTIAVYLLIGGLAGIGLGPTMVAFLSDRLGTGHMALGHALVYSLFPLAVLGLWASWIGLRPYAASLATIDRDFRQAPLS